MDNCAFSGIAEGTAYQAMGRIRVDVSMRERVILPPVNYNIVPIYRDLEPYMVSEMDLKEIFSQKIRAFMTRKKGEGSILRIFPDKKNVKPDPLLVSEKMEFYKRAYDSKEVEKRVKMFRAQWKKESLLLS